MPHLQRAVISGHGRRQQPRIVQDKVRINKRRMHIGWNHTNDTPEGRKTGLIWCAVTLHHRFKVYDKPYDRSMCNGVVRDCGVLNFTMIRMSVSAIPSMKIAD